MRFVVILFFIIHHLANAQPNTDVYLLNTETSNLVNISDNKGYDNQPSFISDSLVLFAKSRQQQTDIILYNINSKASKWIFYTTQGSEFSPVQIPNTKNIATVRLDTTGLQRLYNYNTTTNKTTLVNDSLKIGYHAWNNEHELITYVLGNPSTLVYLNLKDQTQKQIVDNIGRSLQKIPNSNLMSYTSINTDGIHEVYQLDIEDDFSSYYVCDLPIGVQDYTWLNRDVLAIGSASSLFTYDTFVDEDWQRWISLKDHNISNITRLAVSPNGKLIAIVAEETFKDKN
jgi:hypothetical protein